MNCISVQLDAASMSVAKVGQRINRATKLTSAASRQLRSAAFSSLSAEHAGGTLTQADQLLRQVIASGEASALPPAAAAPSASRRLSSVLPTHDAGSKFETAPRSTRKGVADIGAEFDLSASPAAGPNRAGRSSVPDETPKILKKIKAARN
jgi:hypothetical protein